MTAGWVEPGEAWDGALAELEHDVYHLGEWTEVEAGLFSGSARAFHFRDRGESFFLPLVVRPIADSDHVDATSTFGYPGPLTNITDHDRLDDALGTLLEALGNAGVVALFVRTHPLFDLPSQSLESFGTLVRHGDTVAIDLTQSEEEIWRWVKRDHRQDINRARRAGMVARHDPDWGHAEAFLEIYRETMERVRAPGAYFFPREYFFGLRRALGDRLRLWVVEHEGEIASAGLFTQVNGIVQFHLSGTAPAHLQLSPSKLMIDEVRRDAKASGLRIFHLGGGVGGATDSLFEFKSRFSNWHLPFHTWRVIVKPDTYRDLAGNDDTGGFFPGYRKSPEGS
jgi:hypothetical protein